MSSTWEELRFYGQLALNLFQRPYDLHKVTGPLYVSFLPAVLVKCMQLQYVQGYLRIVAQLVCSRLEGESSKSVGKNGTNYLVSPCLSQCVIVQLYVYLYVLPMQYFLYS